MTSEVFVGVALAIFSWMVLLVYEFLVTSQGDEPLSEVGWFLTLMMRGVIAALVAFGLYALIAGLLR